MSNPKVSLLVPCYNIANLCERFFESLLNQTYDNLEIVLVNDGSKDNTEEVLLENKEKLEQRGYEVKYIYQENKGLGGAINTGLKAFTGEFLCWADPDDYFEINSFELRVKYMIDHPDCAIVSSDAYSYNNNEKRLLSLSFPRNNEKNQFELLIKKESMFCPGCHMIRVSDFDKVNPNRDIFEYRRGQNWQLLLPMYYAYERHFLNVPLYNYVVYENSMSHIKESYEEKIQRNNEHKKVIIETLNRMVMPKNEKESLLFDIEGFYNKINMGYAYSVGNKVDYKKYFNICKKHKTTTIKDFIKLILISVKG